MSCLSLAWWVKSGRRLRGQVGQYGMGGRKESRLLESPEKGQAAAGWACRSWIAKNTAMQACTSTMALCAPSSGLPVKCW